MLKDYCAPGHSISIESNMHSSNSKLVQSLFRNQMETQVQCLTDSRCDAIHDCEWQGGIPSYITTKQKKNDEEEYTLVPM